MRNAEKLSAPGKNSDSPPPGQQKTRHAWEACGLLDAAGLPDIRSWCREPESQILLQAA
jgi:hypothetical protein